jgi:hypothetical protein
MLWTSDEANMHNNKARKSCNDFWWFDGADNKLCLGAMVMNALLVFTMDSYIRVWKVALKRVS